MGQKVTFDPINKIIQVTLAPVGGVIDLDVKIDLYSDMKEDWRSDPSLFKFRPPIFAVGGNPLPGSKALGTTFFMDPAWKIRPYEASHRFLVNGNLYSEDGTSPYTTTVGNFNVLLENAVSSLVDSTVQQLPEIERSAFQDRVWVDAINGTTGTEYPAGTPNPTLAVNNITDAITIANDRGFDTIHILGGYDFEATDNLDGFTIEGNGITRSTLTFAAGCSTSNTLFYQATMTGTIDGSTSGTFCYMRNLYGIGCTTFPQTFRNCSLEGVIQLRFDNNVDTHFIDCVSGVAGSATPVIDMLNTATALDFRGYVGGIELRNCNDATATVSLDVEGHVNLASTVADAASIVVRGRGKLTDNSTIATNLIDTENYLQASVIQDSINKISYIGKDGSGVTLDPLNGINSGEIGFGTREFPAKTEQNLQDISAALGFKNVYCITDFNITFDHSGDTHDFYGDNPLTTNINCDATSNVTGCQFYDAYVTGKLDDLNTVRNCTVGSITNANSFIYNSALEGPIVVSNTLSIEECWVSTSAVNQTVTIDFNNLANKVIISDWSAGRILVKNMVTGSFLGMSGTGGRLEIDPLNTGGTVTYGGSIEFIPTNSENLDTISDASIAGQVWDSVTAGHIGADTFGELLDRTRHLAFAVYINTEAVSNGDGSQKSPFNVIADAIDHAEAEGITDLIVLADITLDRNLKNFRLTGIGAPTVDVNGFDLTKSEFSHFRMESTGSYTGEIIVRDCYLLNGFNLNGIFENCVLGGDLFCIDGSNNTLKDCASGIPGTGRPTISMSALGTSLVSIRDYVGGLTIKDCNQVTDVITVDGKGALTFDASNTNGTMVARGRWESFVNSAAGATVITPVGDQTQVETVHASIANRREKDTTAKTLTVYDPDGVTPRDVFTYIDDGSGDILDIIPQ